MLSLNARNNLIKISNISVGTLNVNLAHPREVFEPALRHAAASVVLAHNHPSGPKEPSADDKRVTERLAKAGEILGIELLDHVIVTKKDWYSFKQNAEA